PIAKAMATIVDRNQRRCRHRIIRDSLSGSKNAANPATILDDSRTHTTSAGAGVYAREEASTCSKYLSAQKRSGLAECSELFGRNLWRGFSSFSNSPSARPRHADYQIRPSAYPTNSA